MRLDCATIPLTGSNDAAAGYGRGTVRGLPEDGEGITINTTDIHSLRRIGETVKHTWRGGLAAGFEEDGDFVRVHWTRET